ncbi:glutamine amidotransferase [Schinkia azotoformans]|uniref:ThiJ/PfpI family protein n=1 Tax=Schinkia azotoformans LMG 9581 TaxID=1131731 RepID=K6DSI9_SCHAZ|nr:type 1 glutamine amidotransferase family protein [Schinkia azotoformans]EKN63751.1 ThiJ/PfpI family protein [Schinkia azotoformans LMG 9581]MEC1640962.1 glutamine amidotransferase [Schinkia azotoformans]MEC1944147.1 glutamine amidotransferase [Schinkia azotoformans]MED4354220.1 glutamine amidotransferase [Schinkia azotoformans]
MHTKKVYLYVFDTMSDWEVGYLIAELNTGRYFKKELAPLEVVAVGVDKKTVTTMGGLKILPIISIDECILKSTDVLILPGGNTWIEAIHEPILKKVSKSLKEGIVVAAICGATVGLAKMGLLDSRRHTSNNLEYMKMVCPNYIGEKYYEMGPAVTDGNLVTASGTAPLEFAMHVLKVLDVFAPETLHSWFNLYQTHEQKYFFELMNSIK